MNLSARVDLETGDGTLLPAVLGWDRSADSFRAVLGGDSGSFAATTVGRSSFEHPTLDSLRSGLADRSLVVSRGSVRDAHRLGQRVASEVGDVAIVGLGRRDGHRALFLWGPSGQWARLNGGISSQTPSWGQFNSDTVGTASAMLRVAFPPSRSDFGAEASTMLAVDLLSDLDPRDSFGVSARELAAHPVAAEIPESMIAPRELARFAQDTGFVAEEVALPQMIERSGAGRQL